MAKLASIVHYLDSLLEPHKYNDTCLNGLQVESPLEDIRRIGFAVDAGLSVLEQAVKSECQLLVVHHGMIWDQVKPIAGLFGRKIEVLLRSKCSLYASHLPLDGNREVGNGAELARKLGLENIEPFCEYKGMFIGARGIFSKPTPLGLVVENLRGLDGAKEPLTLSFGKTAISKIGIVTGAGGFALQAAAKDGLDLLVSGEPKHSLYHEAKELQINAVFAGHYATETFGVRALQRRLEKDFDISTVFINEPTYI